MHHLNTEDRQLLKQAQVILDNPNTLEAKRLKWETIANNILNKPKRYSL